MIVSYSRNNSPFAQEVIQALSKMADTVEVGPNHLYLENDSIESISNADFHLLIVADSFFGISNKESQLTLDFTSDVINICLAEDKKLVTLNSSLALGSGKAGMPITEETYWEDDNWMSSALYFQLIHRDITRAIAEGGHMEEFFLPAVEMNSENSYLNNVIMHFLNDGSYPSGSNAVTQFSRVIDLIRNTYESDTYSNGQLIISDNISWQLYLEQKAQEGNLKTPTTRKEYRRPNRFIKPIASLWTSDKTAQQRDFLMSQELVYESNPVMASLS